MKEYTDLDQYDISPDDLMILQNIDHKIPMRKRKGSTIIVQNINIKEREPIDITFDAVVTMIQHYGGVQNFVKAIYSYVIQKNNGNLNKSAEDLRMHRQTLSEYRKKYLLSD